MDNYFDTAERMYDSSKQLHSEGHYFNACYLGGYVYECYGKLLGGVMGLAVNTKSHNLNSFISQVNFILTTNPSRLSSTVKYFLTMDTDCPTLHKGNKKWNPGKRYDPTYGWDDIISGTYQLEVEKCFTKIIEMHLDNLI